MARKEYMASEVQKLMFNLDQIRNIAIVAHVDHGKTTLSDSLVARAGLMSKELAGEQRVMDFDEIEQKRGITIKAAYISLGFQYDGKDYLVNLIDTPGHVDFGGHVTRAMRAVDGVVLVVDAVEGVMPQTETVLRQAMRERSKPVVFINKIDRLINELQLDAKQMQERLLKIILKINKLISQFAPAEFKDEWQIRVEKGNVAFGSAFNKWAISASSMQRLKINFNDIYNYCKESRHKELSEKAPLDEVILEMVVKHLPTPQAAQKYRIASIWHGDHDSEAYKMMTECNKDGKLIGVVFGVAMDPHAGEVAICRLFSGTVRKSTEVIQMSKGEKARVQQVSIYMGPDRVNLEEVPSGNIVALVGLRDLYVGETLSEVEIDPFDQIKHYSQPVVTKSIEAKNPQDLVKLIDVLRGIAKEDPTFKVELNMDTGEHLIYGMGDLHLEIIETKIVNEKGIQIVTSPPIVVYKEFVTKKAGPIEGKSPNKHSKFQVVVEPLEEKVYKAIEEGTIPEGKVRGKTVQDLLIENGLPREEAKNAKMISNGNLFLDMTKGVQYMNEVMELLLQGFEEAVSQGPLAKEKITGMKVSVVDALIHEDPVHRGPAQIIPAIKKGIYAAVMSAGVTLLEPKQKLFVQVPQEYMSGVINNIQGKRGQIMDIQQEEEVVTINAKVPVSEMFGFANVLRGATQGRAVWNFEYYGYEKLPKELQDRIVREIRKRKGEPEQPPTPEFFMD
ncbi:MAG: elongation factor EF-2 [Candidatus Micrarchaeia archaeon]